MGCCKSKVKNKVKNNIQTKLKPKIEAKLKVVAPYVRDAGVVVKDAEGKVKVIGDLLYRAYSMALHYSMGQAGKGLDQVKKCFDVLNNILHKNYVYSDTEEMDAMLQKGIDDLHIFLEENCINMIEKATTKLESIKAPPAKHVLKKLQMARGCVERPMLLLNFMKTFFHVSFKVYKILGEQEHDMLEQSRDELAKVFEEFKAIHTKFFPPTQAQLMVTKATKKKDQLRMFRIKIQKVYHGVELMARKLADSGGKITTMGEAMKISLPQLVKVIFGAIATNLKGDSDLNILLDNSIFYLENSLMKVMENLASSEFDQILDITEHTFDEKIVADVEDIIGWVFPSMYKDFRGDDLERFRKILKVQQWYERLNGLLGNTHELLEQSVDQFTSFSNHLEKGNKLAEVCAKLKICQTKTKEVMENMETSSPVMKVLPKLCRYILAGAQPSSLVRLRKEALEEMKMDIVRKKEEKKKKEEEEIKKKEEEDKKNKKKKKKEKKKVIKKNEEEEKEEIEIKIETEEELKEHLQGAISKLSKSFSFLTELYKESGVKVHEVLAEIDAREKIAQEKLMKQQEKEAKQKEKDGKKKEKDDLKKGEKTKNESKKVGEGEDRKEDNNEEIKKEDESGPKDKEKVEEEKNNEKVVEEENDENAEEVS